MTHNITPWSHLARGTVESNVIKVLSTLGLDSVKVFSRPVHCCLKGLESLTSFNSHEG